LKIQIKSVATLRPDQFYWRVTKDGVSTNYAEYEGAYAVVAKYLKRAYKECSGFSMVSSLNATLLSEQELSLITKLRRTRCKGITKPQYGYLKGIHERQVREW
jgi:hypothetical protein